MAIKNQSRASGLQIDSDRTESEIKETIAQADALGLRKKQIKILQDYEDNLKKAAVETASKRAKRLLKEASDYEKKLLEERLAEEKEQRISIITAS